MGIHHYFKSLSDLETLIRCPGRFKYHEHNVASHSFKVTKIAQFLGTVEEQNGKELDWKALYEKALNHDYAELFTGDIKTPVKYQMVNKFISTEFPPQFQEVYRERFKEGKDETLEGRILSVADKIDLLYESFGEIQKGNPEPLFIEIYQEALSTIVQYKDLECVQYFLEFVLPDMLSEKFIPHSELKERTRKLIREGDE
jgi:putative hydrolases of HD superfamily